MTPPPYSSHLGPNDFFSFPYVKYKMRGQRFSKPEETVDVFRMHDLETITQSECFDNWFKRIQKFRDFNGDILKND